MVNRINRVKTNRMNRPEVRRVEALFSLSPSLSRGPAFQRCESYLGMLNPPPPPPFPSLVARALTQEPVKITDCRVQARFENVWEKKVYGRKSSYSIRGEIPSMWKE